MWVSHDYIVRFPRLSKALLRYAHIFATIVGFIVKSLKLCTLLQRDSRSNLRSRAILDFTFGDTQVSINVIMSPIGLTKCAYQIKGLTSGSNLKVESSLCLLPFQSFSCFYIATVTVRNALIFRAAFMYLHH